MNTTTVIIGNVFDKQKGERKVAKLKEITKDNYYNFVFTIYPVGGSFNIQAASDYDFLGDGQKEMLSIITQLLMFEI